MRSLMRVSTVMWPPQSFYPQRNRARGHAAQGHTPDTTRPRTHPVARGPQIRPVDAVCWLSTHNVNTGIHSEIPGPDPAASQRFRWERAPLAASAETEVGRSEYRSRYNTQRSLHAEHGWTLSPAVAEIGLHGVPAGLVRRPAGGWQLSGDSGKSGLWFLKSHQRYELAATVARERRDAVTGCTSTTVRRNCPV